MPWWPTSVGHFFAILILITSELTCMYGVYRPHLMRHAACKHHSAYCVANTYKSWYPIPYSTVHIFNDQSLCAKRCKHVQSFPHLNVFNPFEQWNDIAGFYLCIFPSLSPHPSLVFNVSIKQWVVYSIPALYLQAAYNCSTTLISGL